MHIRFLVFLFVLTLPFAAPHADLPPKSEIVQALQGRRLHDLFPPRRHRLVAVG